MQDNFPKISFGIIVKNQEQYIEKCIASIMKFSAEIIIIDSGSTDSTVQKINNIKSDKIRVFTEKWCDDFSHHKNLIIKYSSHEILFMIDSDEELFIKDECIFVKEITTMRNGIILNPKINNLNDNKRIFSNQIITRRVFLKNDFRYHGFVHEELRNEQYSIDDVNMHSCEINHYGYMNYEMKKMDKINRNLKLLKKQIENEPEYMRWRLHYARIQFDICYGDVYKKYIFDDLLANITKFYEYDSKNLIYFEMTISLISLFYLSIDNFESFEKSYSYLKDENNMDKLYLDLMSKIDKMTVIINILDKLDSELQIYSSIDETFDYILIEVIWNLYIENNILYSVIIDSLSIKNNKFNIVDKIKNDIDEKNKKFKESNVYNYKAKF